MISRKKVMLVEKRLKLLLVYQISINLLLSKRMLCWRRSKITLSQRLSCLNQFLRMKMKLKGLKRLKRWKEQFRGREIRVRRRNCWIKFLKRDNKEWDKLCLILDKNRECREIQSKWNYKGIRGELMKREKELLGR